jgi:hypothetical protein
MKARAERGDSAAGLSTIRRRAAVRSALIAML